MPLLEKAELCLPSPSHFSLPAVKALGVAETTEDQQPSLYGPPSWLGRVNRRDTEGTRNTGPMSSMTAHHRPGDGTPAPTGTGCSLNVSRGLGQTSLVQSPTWFSQQREWATFLQQRKLRPRGQRASPRSHSKDEADGVPAFSSHIRDSVGHS